MNEDSWKLRLSPPLFQHKFLMPLDTVTLLAKARRCLVIEREALTATGRGLDKHFVAVVRAVESAVSSAKLRPRERLAIMRRLEGARLDDIGAELGVTREGARQIEARAVERVRERLGM